ncbi:iron-sulfur cluster-binding protein [Nocardioides alcanivorans]|uniref:iron-sulfur cluster-binding protein n=1 Tax=Nocardioides alcanivorans TaxID=2897352 RepID=UPI001F3BE371|nr:hypothetical protein [Nocardioides alcanivorans]
MRPLGAFVALTLGVGEVAERCRPGQFLSLADPDPTRLLRRSVPVHRAAGIGVRPGSIEIVLDPSDAAESVIAELAVGARVHALGPLGRPFALPKEAVPCVVTGVGHHAAALFGLADRLAERGCAVHLLLGASSGAHLLPTHDLRRTVRSVTVVTHDGSVGQRARVDDVLGELLVRTTAAVVYAGAPVATLHAVAAVAEAAGAWSQMAVPGDHPCGTGLCSGCPVPVVGEDGVGRTVRGCAEGPVFRGDRVRWDDLIAEAVG